MQFFKWEALLEVTQLELSSKMFWCSSTYFGFISINETALVFDVLWKLLLHSLVPHTASHRAHCTRVVACADLKMAFADFIAMGRARRACCAR